MREPSPWRPRLAEGNAPPSERLARAIAEEAASHRLPAGARLPPHREVARALGIGVGTVTKGYALAERWGIVRGEHGRGTFVIGPRAAAAQAPRIDLSQNLPPPAATDAALAEALTRLARRVGEAGFGSYPPPAGRPAHRAAVARWLAGHRVAVPAERLVLTNGAQHAVAVALAMLCRPGGTVLVEAATYQGVKAVAAHLGYRLRGLAMDAEGVLPAALDAALRELPAPRVAVLVPTLQNPTARTMGAARRREVAAIARRHDAWIVEDDVYSVLAEPGEPTLLELAPERTLYANGLSKALSPGLRLGCLVCPDGLVEAAARGVHATAWTAAPLACLLAAEWLADGTAEAVARAARAEAERRTALAIEAFPRHLGPGQRPTHHVWLGMPEAAAEGFARRALAAGVAVTPPDAPLVDPSLECGVRVCIGAAPSAEALTAALATLRDALEAREAVA